MSISIKKNDPNTNVPILMINWYIFLVKLFIRQRQTRGAVIGGRENRP